MLICEHCGHACDEIVECNGVVGCAECVDDILDEEYREWLGDLDYFDELDCLDDDLDEEHEDWLG